LSDLSDWKILRIFGLRSVMTRLRDLICGIEFSRNEPSVHFQAQI
jgi:hypothetical protein